MRVCGTSRCSPEIYCATELGPVLGIANRMLDVLVAEPSLQRPRVVAGVGQSVPTAVPPHVRMDWKGHSRTRPDPPKQRMESLGRHRPMPFGHEDVRRWPLLAL